MSATVDVKKFLASLDREVKPRAMAAARRGLRRAANATLANAKIMCPIDTGALVASGIVAGEQVTNDLAVQIGFNTSYAAAVHENLTANFNRDANPNAQAKFLETAIRDMVPRLPRILKDEIDKVL